ncbi:type VII secretion protein EssB [Streptococcus sp. H49]|uniref:type VII secretion protein EssB n=1 Tax=Streptococcus huangxiaojuni TaxID=3237239 RepID=UPI0034A1331D
MGDDLIQLKVKKEQLEVTLTSNTFVRDKLSTIQQYVDAQVTLNEGGELALIYKKPPHSRSLHKLTQETRTNLERLELAQILMALPRHDNDFRITYLHPKNIFVRGNVVELLHYGISEIMFPEEYSEEDYLRHYKALVVSVLRPKLDFEFLVNGLSAVNDKTVQEIAVLKNYSDVVEYINRIYDDEARKERESKQLVSIMKWRIVTIAAAVLGVLTVGLGAVAGYNVFWKTPLQTDTVKAQASFLSNDYESVADSLEPYSLARLEEEAKYVLAASYVHLDNLSDSQKASVLNTISPSSEENLLDYWISIGRGKYSKALDLAKNVGDNQLILHAYTNLYEQVKADSNMKGSEKQKKLTSYRKQIKKLSKRLGEQQNE